MTSKQTSPGSKTSTVKSTQETTASTSTPVTTSKVLSKELRHRISSFDLALQHQISLKALDQAIVDLESDDPVKRQTAVSAIEVYLADKENFENKATDLLNFSFALIAMANAKKAEADRLKKLAIPELTKAHRLQELVIRLFRTIINDDNKLTNYRLPMHTIKSMITSSVHVDEYLCDPDSLPDEFKRTKTTVNKQSLKDAFKAAQKNKTEPPSYEGVEFIQERQWRVE
ncbi:MAG: hypothetical protein CMB76_05650 [Euryarchaeota archaeon]|nr:hypothetical protein [Euryarchaeota archaeon]